MAVNGINEKIPVGVNKKREKEQLGKISLLLDVKKIGFPKIGEGIIPTLFSVR